MQRPLKCSRSQIGLDRAPNSAWICIMIDDEKTLHLPLDNLRTLFDLRTALRKRQIVVNENDCFINERAFPIDISDEKKVQIIDIRDSNGIIRIQRNSSHHQERTSRPSSAALYRNSSTSSFEKLYPVVRVSEICTDKWIQILKSNSIFRGRIIRSDGPHISDRSLFRMKPGWKMNVYDQDRTEYRTFNTHDRIEFAFHRAHMFNFNVTANIPFIGLQNQFERSKQSTESNTTEYIYRSFQFDVSRAVCSLERSMIEFVPEFLQKIDEILQNNSTVKQKYEQLCRLFDEYGNYCAMKFVLGGQIVSRSTKTVNESMNEDECQKRLLTQFQATIEQGELSVGINREKTTMNSERRASTCQTSSYEKIGGDTLKEEKNEWLQTLNNVDTWRVIEYEHLEPTYRLLDQHRCQQIEEILDRLTDHSIQRIPIPEQLQFDDKTSLYKFHLNERHSKKKSNIYSFFYIPSKQQWIWNCTSRSKDAWWPINKRAHDEAMHPSVEQIFQILQQPNVYPPDRIIQRCQSFENEYRISAILHLTLSADILSKFK